MTKPVCVVAGIGPGNGAAFARRFAADGHAVALLSRAAEPARELAASLPDARAWQCDVGDAGSVARVFDEIRGALGDPEVVIYNAGSGVFGTFDDVTAADLEASWRVNALGGFLVAKQVVPAMKRAGRGNLVFVGATASRRGAARTAAFAQAKAAQRSLAESLARHLGPAGIHVSLIVIDGVVDLPRTRQRLPDKPDAFFVKPDDVAATAAFLVAQPRSAWTFELEARPFGETW
ncbi:MAG: SDR family NAD(P)-dependent oxidoreductase [Deltaproteobacteria bacterium]|nr:MAG: SDR family NAD(P)-dependent oxidoreductase [Deltaproteobacteria bacterium]TMQ12914.1 MAG: SDR family NAD(P)-dependent oxidoreductase [Deltaproteobacteria bacterium]